MLMNIIIVIVLYVAAVLLLFFANRRGKITDDILKKLCWIVSITAPLLVFFMFRLQQLTENDVSQESQTQSDTANVPTIDFDTTLDTFTPKPPGEQEDEGSNKLQGVADSSQESNSLVKDLPTPVKPDREWELIIIVNGEVDTPPNVSIDGKPYGSSYIFSVKVTEELHEIQASYTNKIGWKYRYSREIHVSSDDTLSILKSDFTKK